MTGVVRGSVRASLRINVVLALLPVTLLALAGVASAGPVVADGAAAARMSLSGPVGVVAVVIGFGGLAMGLLRRRRRAAAARPLRGRSSPSLAGTRSGDRAA